MSASKLISVNFEVFGRVQGVFFRKFTQKEANKLGLKGWCMNTDAGTVQGVIQGEPSQIDQMKSWLKNTGSPQSRIEKVNFTEDKIIDAVTFQEFSIKG